MAAAMKKGRNHDQLHPCLQNTAVSKKFGIEGKKLLTPDDDYEALKDFHSQDEGIRTGKNPFHIQQEHCLSCGNCMKVCPVRAIIRGK